MAKVICTLPNASALIGDVKFVSHRDGMISEEISIEQAKRFCSIPGYRLAGVAGGSEAQPKDTGKKKKKETEKPSDPPGDKDPDAEAIVVDAPVSTSDEVTSTDPALPSGSEPGTPALTPTF